jgi:hypothetical protein
MHRLHVPPGDELHPSPLRQAGSGGQVAGVPHALRLQVTSQRHDELQDTPPTQLATPEQVTWQAPGPHVTPSPHEPLPVHAIEQLVAWEQSTRLQSLLSSHWTVQAMPAGHETVWLRHLLPEQSMVHSA